MANLKEMSALIAFLLLAQSAETYYQRGVELFRKGQAEEARPHLQKAVELAPTAPHWKALGVLEASVGNYAQAEPALRQACRLDPGEEDACYYLGRARYALDRFEASLAALEQALPRDTRPWRVHLGMAQALEALGRASEAEEQFRRALKLAGRTAPDFDARLHLGIFLVRQGRTGEAVEVLGESAREHPGSARAHYQLGRALLQLDRLEEAEKSLRRAVELDPGYGEAHLQLSKLYRRLGKVTEADRHAAQGSRTSR
jgi:tetratricopeptide (TPR) repeat protein